MAVSWAALTRGAPRGGEAMVTRPAPIRRAARAASRAAPVRSAPPDATRAGRGCICGWTRWARQGRPPEGGPVAEEATARRRRAPPRAHPGRCRYPRGDRSPQWARPGRSRWPGLRATKVIVRVARTAQPRDCAVSPSMPRGMSTASTGRPERFMNDTAVSASPSRSRGRGPTRTGRRPRGRPVRRRPRQPSTTGPVQSAAATRSVADKRGAGAEERDLDGWPASASGGPPRSRRRHCCRGRTAPAPVRAPAGARRPRPPPRRRRAASGRSPGRPAGDRAASTRASPHRERPREDVRSDPWLVAHCRRPGSLAERPHDNASMHKRFSTNLPVR